MMNTMEATALCKQKQWEEANEEFVPEKNYTYKRWTIKINKEYIRFLKKHQKQVLQSEVNNAKKFYVRMSIALKRKKTRSQCKIHHHKMLKNYGNIQAIIDKFDDESLNSISPDTPEPICQPQAHNLTKFETGSNHDPQPPSNQLHRPEEVEDSLPLFMNSVEVQEKQVYKDLFDELLE